MDLSQLLQTLQHKRGDQIGLGPLTLLRALKQLVGKRSGSRRSHGGPAFDRPESLEVRQVLSAVAAGAYSVPQLPLEESAAGDFFGQEYSFRDQQNSPGFEAISPDDSVIQMVRDQLSKSLSDSIPNDKSTISDIFVDVSNKGHVNRIQVGDDDLIDGSLVSSLEVAAPEMIDNGMSDSESSANREQLNVSFVIEYSKGPQEVTVETISSNNLQIKVSGLAGTIYEFSGAEFTAQAFYENAIDVLQQVQPTRQVQILFPSGIYGDRHQLPANPGPSIDDLLPIFQETGLSPSPEDTQTSPDFPAPLSNSLATDAASNPAADDTSIDSSLIDQLFAISNLALDTSILIKTGIVRLQQTLAWPPTDAPSTDLRHQDELSRQAVSLRHEPSSILSTIVVTSPQSGVVRPGRRSFSWLRSGRLAASSLLSDSVVTQLIFRVAEELSVRPGSERVSQNSSTEGVEWLSWLLKSSGETNQPLGIGTKNRVRRIEFTPEPVPTCTDSVSNLRDARGTYVPQAQIRKYREQYRHNGGLNGAICIALYEQETSRVPQSSSVPRELTYVANPRGPPVYGRDADVPLFEVAPADLLERLRYSIAPRGPSLATVETQSPDFTFSSGPSMSSEKVSTKLAI